MYVRACISSSISLFGLTVYILHLVDLCIVLWLVLELELLEAADVKR